MNDDELVSRARTAEVLKRNGRTINAALENVPPDEAEPGRSAGALASILPSDLRRPFRQRPFAWCRHTT